MLLTGKEPAQQLYAQIDQRISAAATVPGLFALYDPEDVPAGWYLRRPAGRRSPRHPGHRPSSGRRLGAAGAGAGGHDRPQ